MQTQVIVEVETAADVILFRVTAPDGAGVELEMDADGARDLCNMIGGGILAASRTSEVVT